MLIFGGDLVLIFGVSTLYLILCEHGVNNIWCEKLSY